MNAEGGRRGVRAGILVMAKAPVPGRVKTRLCPPCTFDQAAALAEASLADTLAAVCATPAAWRVVALEGEAGPWLPPGVGVVAQRGAGLDERLAAAFDDTGGPAVVVAADTPQVTPELLDAALSALSRPGVDAVLGPTDDAGYWALGLCEPRPEVFVGISMSRPTTLASQRRRLRQLGLRVAELPSLRDVDEFGDAVAVAASIPTSRFAAALAAIAEELDPSSSLWPAAGGRQ